MAIGDTYITLAELKDYLSLPVSKQSLDLALESAIESATQEIERQTNRQFNKEVTATPRVFRPTGRRTADVADFHTTTGLVVKLDTGGDGTFATTLSPSDYELMPFDGVVDGQSGWPFSSIALLSGSFPCNRRSGTLQVTAQWGWDEVPAPVRQACFIIAAETFQMKDAPFGVAGSDQFGNVLRVRDNRMAVSKLARYCRDRILVG